jgi:hypothetical protein
MIKGSEAAATVRAGPAAPSWLTALVVSAVHMPGPVGRAGAAASFRLRVARPAGPFVLAWAGDRSPIRGCTTTSGDRVPPGHMGVEVPRDTSPGIRWGLRARPRYRARAPLDRRAGNAVTSTWRVCRHDHLDTAPLNQLGQGNDAHRPGSSNPAPHRPRHPDRQCD